MVSDESVATDPKATAPSGQSASDLSSSDRTPYERLRTLNHVDATRFTELDKHTAQQYWADTFLGNMVGDEIFDAIASKSGTAAKGNTKSMVSFEFKYLLLLLVYLCC